MHTREQQSSFKCQVFFQVSCVMFVIIVTTVLIAAINKKQVSNSTAGILAFTIFLFSLSAQIILSSWFRVIMHRHNGYYQVEIP